MSFVRRSVRLWASCLVPLALVVTACGSPDGDDKPAKSTTAPPSSAPGSSLEGKSTLLFGLKKGQPGFSTKKSDVFEGFEADFAQELASALGVDSDFRDIPSLRREEILRDRNADLIIATYSITDARDEQIDFTAPYFKTYQGLLIRDGDTSIKSLDDVDGKRVCTAYGSTSDPKSVRRKEEQKVIKETLGTNVKPGFRKDYKECVRETQKRNFDAVWTDKILLKGFEARYEGVHVADDITIENPQYYGVGLREGDEKFCKRLNKAVRDFVFSADWRAYFKTHFDKVYDDDPSGIATEYRPDRAEFDDMEKASCGAND